MDWWISGFPTIDFKKYHSIVEFRNAPIDWGEFEGEKKFLLAVAEILGERWESAKPFLHANTLDLFDQEGFVFLWFRRYMPEVFEFNPWMLADLVETTKIRNSNEHHEISCWVDLLTFNIAFNQPGSIESAFRNVGHDSSLARFLVRETLFWCYDLSPGNRAMLVRSINNGLYKGYNHGFIFELLILLYGIPELRPMIENVASTDWSKLEIEFDMELKEFLEGKRDKLKRKNPIQNILNHVMLQVLSIMMEATSKYLTYDVAQGVLFEQESLLSEVKKRYEMDVMNKSYYLLERSKSGEISLTGANF